jgi:hypothetical protein
MKKLIMKPDNWVCTLEECPPGFFVVGCNLCFKTEYHKENGQVKAFNEAGEYFCSEDDRKVMVQPVVPEWEE